VDLGFGLCTGNQTNENAKYFLVREGAENDLRVRQCTFVHVAAYCHTRDATQRGQFSELTPLSCIACMTICCSVHKSELTCQFGELTPLSCIACMTICCSVHKSALTCQFGELTPLSCIACMPICCSVHKSALTYTEIIFSAFSNQKVLCICICLISCTESET